MVNLVYDGSWEGLLTAVFEVYEYKFKEVSICKQADASAAMFTENIKVISSQEKSVRVWNALKKHISATACKNIFCCHLSELKSIENVVLDFIKLSFSMEEAEKAFGNSSVLKVSQVAKMVHREKHRMEAFIRFKLTADGIYFSEIDPDFNVLPLIAQHFEKRYADQKWLIYDLKRKYGIFYDLSKVEEVSLDFSEPKTEGDTISIFNENEEIYQSLWKDYFKHVNIKERRNMKLHLRHVPKRYWKYLVEKKL